MPSLSTTVYQWILKVKSLLLHRTNLICKSLLTLLVFLSLQYLSNLKTLRKRLRHFYITGVSSLDLLCILSLLVDQNILTQIWHIFVHSWVFDPLLEHNFISNKDNTCKPQNCPQLLEHFITTKLIYPFVYKTLSKLIPQWFLAVMLQFYSIVHASTLKKFNSQAYITKTYKESKTPIWYIRIKT